MAEYDDPRIAHKMNASFWLAQTDSTQLPDVIGLIQNIDEINAYRTELRKIVIEMPKVVENWPEKPETIWNVSGVPTMVSMRQAQQSLNDADLLELVESHFDTLPNSKRNRAIKIDWKKAKHVARNSDLVVSLAGVLSLDDSQVDAMFIDALNYPE
jgi:predicted metallopeptidase